MNWLENPSAWTAVGAVVAQAIITWWRVGEMDKRIAVLEDCIDESKQWRAKYGQLIDDLVRNVDEVRRKVWNGVQK